MPKLEQHKGEIAAFFPKAMIQKYSTPFRYALVGKFSQGRPLMEIIQKFFVSQDLKDQFSVGLLDSKHVLIRLQGEADFHRIYPRMIWYIAGKPMRVFKWTEQFHVDKESSLYPIWIKFPKLPVHFFNKEALFSLASLFGHPLRLDSATTLFKRPSVARLQVEIDLQKSLPSRLCIGTDESQGFWQQIELDENLPSYCNYCWHIGHDETACYVKNPVIKPTVKPYKPLADNKNPKGTMQYQPKKSQKSQPQKEPGSSGLTVVQKLNIGTCVEPEGPILQQEKGSNDGEVVADAPVLLQDKGTEDGEFSGPDQFSSEVPLVIPAEKGTLQTVIAEELLEVTIDAAELSAKEPAVVEIAERTTHDAIINTPEAIPTQPRLEPPQSAPLPTAVDSDYRPVHSDGEPADNVHPVLIDELKEFSDTLRAIIPVTIEPADTMTTIVRKRRPRRNYFNQPPSC